MAPPRPPSSTRWSRSRAPVLDLLAGGDPEGRGQARTPLPRLLSERCDDDQGTWEDAAATADRIREDLLSVGFPHDRLFLNIFVDLIRDEQLLRFKRKDPSRSKQALQGIRLQWFRFQVKRLL